jgi:hypothetical protein
MSAENVGNPYDEVPEVTCGEAMLDRQREVDQLLASASDEVRPMTRSVLLSITTFAQAALSASVRLESHARMSLTATRNSSPFTSASACVRPTLANTGTVNTHTGMLA